MLEVIRNRNRCCKRSSRCVLSPSFEMSIREVRVNSLASCIVYFRGLIENGKQGKWSARLYVSRNTYRNERVKPGGAGWKINTNFQSSNAGARLKREPIFSIKSKYENLNRKSRSRCLFSRIGAKREGGKYWPAIKCLRNWRWKSRVCRWFRSCRYVKEGLC